MKTASYSFNRPLHSPMNIIIFIHLALLSLFLNRSTFAVPSSPHQISIAGKYCKGTVITLKPGSYLSLTPPKLAVVTAAHCLENKLKPQWKSSKTMGFLHSTKNPKLTQHRIIKNIIWTSNSMKSAVKTLSTLNETEVAIWCRENHVNDIAIIVIEGHVADTLQNRSTRIEHFLPSTGSSLIKFKSKEVKLTDDFSFNSSRDAEVEINKGNSGTPFYVDNKISGVASCIIESNSDGTDNKQNFFAAWNETLQTALEKNTY